MWNVKCEMCDVHVQRCVVCVLACLPARVGGGPVEVIGRGCVVCIFDHRCFLSFSCRVGSLGLCMRATVCVRADILSKRVKYEWLGDRR